MARSLMERSNSMMGDTLGPKAYADKLVSEMEWATRQLPRIKRIASGDLRPEDLRDEPIPCYGGPSDLSELKSVAPRAREFINRVHAERRQRESMIERAKEALLEYDQTGILRHFF
jgi:hypothetical protein